MRTVGEFAARAAAGLAGRGATLRGLGALVWLLAWLVPATASLGPADATPAPGGPSREAQAGLDAFSRPEPVPGWVAPVELPPDDSAQPVVYRLVDTQFLADTTPVMYVRRAVRVNDAAALATAGQVLIPFVPQYQRLRLHHVRILRGRAVLDRTLSTPVRFAQRDTGFGQGVYSGEVTASIAIDDLRVGDTLDYAYSLVGQNPVFGDRFLRVASWDQPQPTDLRRVVLIHKASRPVRWRALGDGSRALPVPVETLRDGMRTLVFEERAMPALRLEPFAPADDMAYRWLQFAEFPDWAAVVAWADGLFHDDGPPDAAVAAVADRLRGLADAGRAGAGSRAAGPDPEAQVAAALAFVQSDIRYFAVALGESSHRPTKPEVVLQRGYGDCKDKSRLLIALLAALGIESHPVLLEVGRHEGLEQMLPSPLLFDHAIVQVVLGGRTFYLDPTLQAQYGRLDRMGQAHEGTQVLVVAPGTLAPSRIVSPNAAELARDDLSETAVLDDFRADGRLQLRQTWVGRQAEAVRLAVEQQPPAQIAAALGSLVEGRYPGAQPVGEPEIQDDRVENRVVLTSRYRVPDMAREVNGVWAVRFAPSNFRGALIVPPAEGERHTPLAVPRYPFVGRYSFEATLPPTVSVLRDPAGLTLENAAFRYTARYAFRGNTWKSELTLTTLADRVPVADLPRYAEDLRTVDTRLLAAAVVGPGDMRPADAAVADFPTALRRRLQEAAAQRSAEIASGRLAGEALADAYCQRSTSRSELGEHDAALADADAAVRLAPTAARIVACRGEAYYQSGQFMRAVSEFTRGMALGDASAEAYFRRSLANYYAGALAAAADDLARASTEGTAESQAYVDLWLVWTYRRLDRPIPPAVAARAAAQQDADWPHPALAMLLGRITPEAMLHRLDDRTGDERTMGLAEAYFYLGQHALLEGDTPAARVAFEKTRQLGVLVFTEHTAAGFELQRLGAAAP